MKIIFKASFLAIILTGCVSDQYHMGTNEKIYFKGLNITNGQTKAYLRDALGHPFNEYKLKNIKGVNFPRPDWIDEGEEFYTMIYELNDRNNVFLHFVNTDTYKKYEKEPVSKGKWYLILIEVYPQDAIF